MAEKLGAKVSMTERALTSPNVQQGADVVLRSLRKHWILGSVIAVAVFSAVTFYTIGQKRIYSASATIQIDPNPPKPLGKDVQTVVDMGAGTYWTNKEYYGTQLEILRGRSVAKETASRLGLQHDAAFLLNLPKGAQAAKLDRYPELDEAAEVLRARLTFEQVKDSRLVLAKAEDANGERARRILATLLNVYLERNVNQTVASSEAASVWLRNQTDKLKDELEKSELALHEYKKEKRILSVSIDDQSNLLRGEMQQLSEALTRANSKREEVKARVAELDKVDAETPTNLPSSELLGSTLLSSLRQDYLQATAELESSLGAGIGEKHPKVEALRPRVTITRDALMTEVRNVQGALRADLEAVSKEAQGLSRLFEQAKQRALDLNMLEIEYRRLERSKSNTEKLFGLVLERSKETDLTGMLRFNNIAVAEAPVATQFPIRPKVPANLAVGLLLGLMLGFAGALGREWFDRTIRTPNDVEELIGVPLLGLLPTLDGKVSSSGYYSRYGNRRKPTGGLPHLNDTAVELIVHALPASNAAECARGVRTSLTFSSVDKPHKTILVTSGNPSEGKTMVASTIAIAFAQTGQRVVLVDCDLRRARLHRVFKLGSASGVSSALQNLATLDTAILATEVPNLSLLPAGPHVPNPAELLQSESFERLLLGLAERFDRVIVDSPPVLVVTDAAVLASKTDAVVVVMRARRTRRDMATQVVRKLTELGGNLVGVVLNAMEEPKRKGGYYYGYYSRDRYRSAAETDGTA